MSDDFDDGVGGDDSVTEVSEQSWLGRLAGSFVAALIGFVLFLASFVLLYWNEGRAVAEIDSLNAGARSVVSVPADAIDRAHEGQLVHVTATAAVDGTLTDPVFHVGQAGAMRLRRHVEMYQWHEHEETKTEKRIGGGETKVTTYTYAKEWSEAPIDPAKFKKPGGHANPPMPMRSAVFEADAVKLGAYRLDASLVKQMSGFKAYAPPAAATGADVNPPFKRFGDQFYHGAAPETPEVGDIRISWEVIDVQPVSVVAAQIGTVLAPFRGQDGRTIELVDLGTRSAGDMFQEAKNASRTLTWILRGVGFVAMVIGVALLAAPLAWLASVLPFLEGVVDAAAVFVAVIVSVPLTLATIAVAWMAHRPLLGGGLLLGGILIAVAVRWVAPRRRKAVPAPA